MLQQRPWFPRFAASAMPIQMRRFQGQLAAHLVAARASWFSRVSESDCAAEALNKRFPRPRFEPGR